MGQVTIYLDEPTTFAMKQAANDAGVSQSQWIAGLIRNKTCSQWPESIKQLAGSWSDFPEAEEIRAGQGKDVERESL